MKKAINRAAIRAMSYQARLRHYEREKNDLFFQIRDLPACEVARRHEELARKWMV